MSAKRVIMQWIALVVTFSVLENSAGAAEWSQGYNITSQFSGATEYQVDSNNYLEFSSAKYDDAKPGDNWTFNMTPREFLAKVAPGMDASSASSLYFNWKSSGGYSIGSVYPTPLSAGATEVFVTNGSEYRSNKTSAALKASDAVGEELMNLNAKGQFLFTDGTDSILYDFATDTRQTLNPLNLGTNQSVYALGIDNNGTVVGTQRYQSGNGEFQNRAFIYQNGSMKDLNDLITLSDGQIMTFAYDLTETGDIIGRIENPSGSVDWVKLTPVPEPSTLIIAVAAIGLTVMQRRSRYGKSA